MSGRVSFRCKPLSLSVVAAIAALSAMPVEALLLPPKPLALSSSWDCRSTANNDWLCRSSQHSDYNLPLEHISRKRELPETSTHQVEPQATRYSAPRQQPSPPSAAAGTCSETE